MAGEGLEPQATSVAGIVVSAMCLLMWLWIVPTLSSLNSSDAAGNAMSQAFTALALLVLWVLLAVLAIIAWFKGGVPGPAAVAALILIPGSGFAVVRALELLSRPGLPPYHWPIVIPALVPPLIVLFCLWAVVRPLRAIVPAAIAGGFSWGAIVIVCLSLVPMDGMRTRATDELDAASRQHEAAYAAIPPDAPLWAWLPFLDTNYGNRTTEALANIRRNDRRQTDAEIMLDRGDFPLGFMGAMDLTPTQTICDTARALLRQRAAKLVPPTPNARPYSDVRIQVSEAVSAMQWLVGYDCPCDAESQAWQAVAESYRNPGFETVELSRLRDPQALGRRLRETPDRFSMLSPKSHLKAWLKYADDPIYREQALAGARALDHRTADALSMLTEQYDPWAPLLLLKYLPVLDLETAEPLCNAALSRLRDDFAKTFRPRPDDPRSYDELLSRLGVYQPLAALEWLAGHGCNADAVLAEAIDLVRAYGDSPERRTMLAKLEQLRRNLN